MTILNGHQMHKTTDQPQLLKFQNHYYDNQTRETINLYEFLRIDTWGLSYQTVVVNVRHHILLTERHHLQRYHDTVCVPFCIRESLAMLCQSNIVFLSELLQLDQSVCIQEKA